MCAVLGVWAGIGVDTVSRLLASHPLAAFPGRRGLACAYSNDALEQTAGPGSAINILHDG
jgi:hypothetical protein